MAEKKIVSLPPARVDESTLEEIRGLAIIRDVSVSWLVRKAVLRYLDEEHKKSNAHQMIFAGRDRRINQSRAEQSPMDTENEVTE